MEKFAAHLKSYHQKFMDLPAHALRGGGRAGDEVMALAIEAFGEAKGRAVAPPRISPEPPPEAPRVGRRELKRAQSHLVLGFLGARVTDQHRRALEVLSQVLSGQGGRLFTELRDKRSMAYAVSSVSVEGLDPGYFAVYMGTSPEKVDEALSAIKLELRKLGEEKVSEDELTRAKRHLVGMHEVGLQRNGARAALLALDYCYGLGLDSFFNYSDEVMGVGAEEVRSVARRVIDLDRSALVVVGP